MERVLATGVAQVTTTLVILPASNWNVTFADESTIDVESVESYRVLMMNGGVGDELGPFTIPVIASVICFCTIFPTNKFDTKIVLELTLLHVGLAVL